MKIISRSNLATRRVELDFVSDDGSAVRAELTYNDARALALRLDNHANYLGSQIDGEAAKQTSPEATERPLDPTIRRDFGSKVR